jgi:hypothetical protein
MVGTIRLTEAIEMQGLVASLGTADDGVVYLHIICFVLRLP